MINAYKMSIPKVLRDPSLARAKPRVKDTIKSGFKKYCKSG
jgi:hypothetical protein